MEDDSAPSLKPENTPPGAPAPNWAGETLLTAGLFLYAVTCNFSITAAQSALGIGWLGMLRLLWSRARLPRWSPLERPFAAFALAGLFSLANVIDLGRGVVEMKKFLILAVFWLPYWAALPTSVRRPLAGVLVFSGALVAVASVIKMVYIDENFRAYGFFSLPLTFGECQALTAIVALAWLGTGDNSRLVRLLLLGSFFALLGGVLISFSRGAWVGLTAGSLYVFLRSPRRLLPLLVAVCLACGAMLIVSNGLYGRLKSFDLQTNFFRFRIWQIGFDILDLHPVFGVGMNNVKPHYHDRVLAFDRAHNEVHGHLHNTFMQILVMTGLFGLTTFMWFIAEMWQFCRHAASASPEGWDHGLAQAGPAVLLCFLAAGLTEYSFGDEEVAMLAFFLIGLCAASYPTPEKSSGLGSEPKTQLLPAA